MAADVLEFRLPNAAPIAPPPTQPADAAERAAALDVERSFLVEAPAGSGKTGLLVQRLLRLLCRVDRPEAVLALTFTNKATAEMRERVLDALDLVARDPAELGEFKRETRQAAANLLVHDRALGWNLRENSFRLNIRTIDSLCGEIARALPLTAGSVGQMEPVENASALHLRAARAVMLRLGGDNAVLNDALRNVLLHRDANLQECERLLAEMLGTREHWGDLIPLTPAELTDEALDREVKPQLDRTLQAVVCKRLGEIERAFPQDELRALTSLAAQLAHLDGVNGKPNPVAGCAMLRGLPGSDAADLDHWVMLAHLLLTSTGWRKSMAKSTLRFEIGSAKGSLQRLLDDIAHRDDLRDLLLSLSNLPPACMPERDWRMSKALFQLLHFGLLELQLIFQRENVCDFTELSLRARAALRDGDSRDRFGNTPSMRLEHLLVDEMQDTSSAQYELLQALTDGWDGTSQTVFLVGDPKQSIYLFRQARVERFLASLNTGEFDGIKLNVLRLTTNFRSAAPLVDEFNRLFAPVFADPASGGVPYGSAVAARVAQPGLLRWHVDPLTGDHGSEQRRQSRLQVQREQAEHIVHTIAQLRAEAERKPPSIAVLVRSRNHAARIIRALREAAIPFRGVELERLNERPEVLDTLALTRALLHPADRVAWLAVLRAPWCGATLADLHQLTGADDPGLLTRSPRLLFRERLPLLAPTSQARIARTLIVMDEALAAIGRLPVSQLVERTGRALGAHLFRTEAERVNVRRLLELIEQAEAELLPVDAAMLEARMADLYAEPDSAADAVEIMTVHKAKGLEWDVVFVPETQHTASRDRARLLDWLELPDAVEGGAHLMLAPIAPRGEDRAELGCYVQNARNRETEAELARLLYVVCTRARSQLHLYAAPAFKKNTAEITRTRGTLLNTAWPGAGGTVQGLAETKAQPSSEALDLVAAEAEEGDRARIEATTRLRVPDSFNPVGGATPLPLPWLHALAEHAPAPRLEVVDRAQGGLAARALGTTLHLFLDRIAAELRRAPATTPNELVSQIGSWSARIAAMLRNLGTTGPELDRSTSAVLRMLTQTVQHTDGFWLLQPHAGAASEQDLSLTDEDGAMTTLRLDRTFLAGATPGSRGTDTLWVVDYKTARPGDQPLAEFLNEQRERYAPQLRNYAKALAARRGNDTSSPGAVRLALFYPAVPTLDYWTFDGVAEAVPAS